MHTTTNELNKNMNTANADTASTQNTGFGNDEAFMMKVAEINMEEIKLGRLAQQKGTAKHVKDLGKMMVDEHTKAMKDLTVLAAKKNIPVPAAETAKIMDAYRTLSAKSGNDFGKSYSDMMVNGHKEAIALFEKTVQDTKDADIKAMATTMLPALKSHLEHAEMCKAECDKM